MAEGIDDPTHSPAVLLAHRRDLGGTGTHGLIKHRVGIVDNEQCSTRGSPNGSGAEALHARIRLSHPELGGPDRQLSHDVVPVADAVNYDGVERCLVEGDRALAPSTQVRAGCSSCPQTLTSVAWSGNGRVLNRVTAGMDRVVGRRLLARLFTRAAVCLLTQQVDVPEVTGGLFNQVQQDPS